MSAEEIEKHIRDHDEAIRNLERIGGETVAALRSLHQRMSKAQEYYLRDNRITAEDLKATIKEAASVQAIGCAAHEVKIKAIEDRTGELEKYTTKAENNIWWLDRWTLGLTAVLLSYLGWDTFGGSK